MQSVRQLITHNSGGKHENRRRGRLQMALWTVAILGLSVLVGLRLSEILSSASGDVELWTTPTAVEKSSTCQWIVLAGDSNIRMAYYEWAKREQDSERSTVLQASWKPVNATGDGDARRLLACDESTWRWVDTEMVLLPNAEKTDDPTCRIVTLKFLTNQFEREVGRLSNLSNHSSHYCPGFRLEDVLPRGYARPPVPDAIWLSHGLWGLPNAGKIPDDTLDCDRRFAPHVRILREWIQIGVRSLTWQTLFPINGHPTTTNAYLEWDYHCQLETAQRLGLSDYVFDLYRRVQPNRPNMFPKGDYHFSDHTFVLRQQLEKCCGGWDHYWGVQ